MDLFLATCQGIGLALAAGTFGGASGRRGVIGFLLAAAAAIGGGILFGASLATADHPAWPGWLVGAVIAVFTFGIVNGVVAGALARHEGASSIGLIVALGALVLAWDAAKQGALDPSDGDNLVLHEFAHQLDYEDNQTNGTPALETRAAYLAWGRVMSEEFAALRQAEEAHRPTLIDQYGATNPAEFFAVITEAFFERPHALRKRHPELYAELTGFYRQDPSSFVPPEDDQRAST